MTFKPISAFAIGDVIASSEHAGSLYVAPGLRYIIKADGRCYNQLFGGLLRDDTGLYFRVASSSLNSL